MVEFRFRREIRVEHAGTDPLLVEGARLPAARIPRPCRAGHHFRQAVIGLRPQHDVDFRHPAHDLGALGLGHTAGDRDDHVAASGLFARLVLFQPAELAEGLLGGLFADMTGIEDHHIGVGLGIGRAIAKRRQNIRHAGGVIDVHLAAIGLDEELLSQGGFRPSFSAG